MAEYRSDRSTVERLEINTCSLGTMRAHHELGQCCSILLGVGRLRNENIWPMDIMRPGHETRETTMTWSPESLKQIISHRVGIRLSRWLKYFGYLQRLGA